MTSWRTKYASKLMSAAEALRSVKSGDRVVIGHACGEPPTLVDALVARAPELEAVEIVHMVAMGRDCRNGRGRLIVRRSLAWACPRRRR